MTHTFEDICRIEPRVRSDYDTAYRALFAEANRCEDLIEAEQEAACSQS